MDAWIILTTSLIHSDDELTWQFTLVDRFEKPSDDQGKRTVGIRPSL